MDLFISVEKTYSTVWDKIKLCNYNFYLTLVYKKLHKRPLSFVIQYFFPPIFQGSKNNAWNENSKEDFTRTFDVFLKQERGYPGIVCVFDNILILNLLILSVVIIFV
jgi:hypothetical protein